MLVQQLSLAAPQFVTPALPVWQSGSGTTQAPAEHTKPPLQSVSVLHRPPLLDDDEDDDVLLEVVELLVVVVEEDDVLLEVVELLVVVEDVAPDEVLFVDDAVLNVPPEELLVPPAPVEPLSV